MKLHANIPNKVENTALSHDSSVIVAGGVSPVSRRSLTDVLIDQAKRENAVIARMKEMVVAGNKEAVFELAKELTCVKN